MCPFINWFGWWFWSHVLLCLLLVLRCSCRLLIYGSVSLLLFGSISNMSMGPAFSRGINHVYRRSKLPRGTVFCYGCMLLSRLYLYLMDDSRTAHVMFFLGWLFLYLLAVGWCLSRKWMLVNLVVLDPGMEYNPGDMLNGKSNYFDFEKFVTYYGVRVLGPILFNLKKPSRSPIFVWLDAGREPRLFNIIAYLLYWVDCCVVGRPGMSSAQIQGPVSPSSFLDPDSCWGVQLLGLKPRKEYMILKGFVLGFKAHNLGSGIYCFCCGCLGPGFAGKDTRATRMEYCSRFCMVFTLFSDGPQSMFWVTIVRLIGGMPP